MNAIAAALTALSLGLAYLPGVSDRTSTHPLSSSSDYEIVDRGDSIDDQGRQITYAIWLENGELQADVSIFDPVSGDSLEMWLENGNLRFEGVAGGEPFSGAEPASTFFDTNPDTPACVGWVALVCIGAAVILSSGCSYLSGCIPPTDTSNPGEQGGVPDEDEGGGGDAEDED